MVGEGLPSTDFGSLGPQAMDGWPAPTMTWRSLARSVGSCCPQGRGGRFAKELTVIDTETSEFPEPEVCCDFGHPGDVGIGPPQGSPRQMHATKQQVLRGAHSEMLLTSHSQRSARNTERVTRFWDVQWLERMHCHDLAEPADDKPVMLQGCGVRAKISRVDASQHGLDQRLLQPARGCRLH
jgi:hypothetical protein